MTLTKWTRWEGGKWNARQLQLARASFFCSPPCMPRSISRLFALRCRTRFSCGPHGQLRAWSVRPHSKKWDTNWIKAHSIYKRTEHAVPLMELRLSQISWNFGKTSNKVRSTAVQLKETLRQLTCARGFLQNLRYMVTALEEHLHSQDAWRHCCFLRSLYDRLLNVSFSILELRTTRNAAININFMSLITHLENVKADVL